MAKKLTATWQEAMEMVSECKVVQKPVVDAAQGTLVFLLEDPAGQTFMLSLRATVNPAMQGNIMTINTGLQIDALEPQPGDRVGDRTF